MNNIYIYNDSFISMLNLIDLLIQNNITPHNIKDTTYNPTLFDNLINFNIKYDENILEKTNKIILKYIYEVFISNNSNKELIIYYFYKNYLKYGLKVLNMYNLKCVLHTKKISKYIRNEAHKYKGFIRFKELKNKCLYTEIEPVNNILFLVSNHFKIRLKNEYWIIKDNKHNLISIYDKNDFYIFDSNKFKLLDSTLNSDEVLYQNLWKDFYKTIGIETRKNNKCRMNFMPKRYWKYLIEMEDDNEKSN